VATATRGLTDTKEGRFVVIAVVGGTLMLFAAVGNLLVAGAADSAADEVRTALRRDLAAVSDEMIEGYPATRQAIEDMAAEAVTAGPGRLLGSAQVDDDEVVVAVQTGWGWQVRCVEAELQGDATVLTYVRSRPC
jgi:hypothetical protein